MALNMGDWQRMLLSLLGWDRGYGTAEKAFSKVLSSLIEKARKKEPRLFSSLRRRNSLTVLDIGCGYFRYGRALNSAMRKINPSVHLLAVDKRKFHVDYSPARFIQADAEHIANELKNLRIRRIDILTVFNPFPGIPNIKNLQSAVAKDALLIGCVDWNRALFEQSLKENHYWPVVWQENFHWHDMRPWFNNYDPFVFAVPSEGR